MYRTPLPYLPGGAGGLSAAPLAAAFYDQASDHRTGFDFGGRDDRPAAPGYRHPGTGRPAGRTQRDRPGSAARRRCRASTRNSAGPSRTGPTWWHRDGTPGAPQPPWAATRWLLGTRSCCRAWAPACWTPTTPPSRVPSATSRRSPSTRPGPGSPPRRAGSARLSRPAPTPTTTWPPRWRSPPRCPPVVEVEPCPSAHLHAMLIALPALREHAELALFDLDQACQTDGQRQAANQPHQLGSWRLPCQPRRRRRPAPIATPVPRSSPSRCSPPTRRLRRRRGRWPRPATGARSPATAAPAPPAGPCTRQKFWELVAARRAAGRTVLIVSHFVVDEQRFDRIVAIRDGKAVPR